MRGHKERIVTRCGRRNSFRARRVADDTVHPNWLGHYLAVSALRQHVATDPAWTGWLSAGAPSTP